MLIDFTGIVKEMAASRPQAVALGAAASELDWQSLDLASRQLAAELRSRGMGPGSHIAAMLTNGLFIITLFLACRLINAVLIPINWRLSEREISDVLDDCDACLLLIDESKWGDLAASIRSGRPDEKVLAAESHAMEASWYQGVPPLEDGVEPRGEDAILIIYTSGTTGHPKGAILSLKSWSKFVRNAVDELRLSHSSRHLLTLPLFHVGGWGLALAALSAKASTYFIDDLGVPQLTANIAQHQITHTALVPVILQRLADDSEPHDRSLHSLEIVAYGTSPITPKLLTEVKQALRCGLVQLYGLTETCGGCVVLRPEDHIAAAEDSKLGTCGVAMEGVEIKIVDPGSASECEPNKVGEIWVRSEQVMTGYWNNPKATSQALTSDGWMRTGDLGSMDTSGYLKIQGRLKDMIITGGENVYAGEVERILSNHPDVLESAVIGVPDRKWGEAVKAFIVFRSSSDTEFEEIDEFMKRNISRYKCPKYYSSLESLPRNALGKVDKASLPSEN